VSGLLEAPRCAESQNAALAAAYVIERLQEAGATLLALPRTGHSTRLRTSYQDVALLVASSQTSVSRRYAAPAPDAIDRMDEALAWISLIPQDRYVLRRIVGARAVIDPISGRHWYSWRRLGWLLGADHKAVKRWHAQGIALIVSTLAAESRPRRGCA
jgi:hypothetical protein